MISATCEDVPTIGDVRIRLLDAISSNIKVHAWCTLDTNQTLMYHLAGIGCLTARQDVCTTDEIPPLALVATRLANNVAIPLITSMKQG
jgi:hypothetical protein